MRIAGIDGCPGGWVCVTRTDDHPIQVAVFPDVGSLMASVGDVDVIGVDIPIGLSERDPRQCDVEVRRLLGPRGASVFPAPVRAALAGSDYPAACALSEQACGKRLSKQVFNILPRVRDMDRVLSANPSLAARTYEVHPELSFAMMRSGAPMSSAKKTAQGREERIALIEQVFQDDARDPSTLVFHRLRPLVPRRAVGDDDLLDALAVLWTGGRIGRDHAMQVPRVEQRDAVGLRMAIVA